MGYKKSEIQIFNNSHVFNLNWVEKYCVKSIFKASTYDFWYGTKDSITWIKSDVSYGLLGFGLFC